jgi:hypothetical protein
MLNVLESRQLILKKQYPFILGATLCGLTIISILIAFAAGAKPVSLLTILGAELLLYMLLNAVSCLIVPSLSAHVKRTIPTYIVNFLIVGIVLFMLLGADTLSQSDNFYPALGALVFCFFASMILILVIRAVANFLKNE